MIGRPLIHELAIPVRMREQHPAGSPTVGIMCPCCWWCLRNVLSSAATFMGTPRLLNRCALQDRHTTGVAARLLTSRLSFENYGPITTDTPPGSAGNRRDTRTPVWAPARSRSSAEEPGHKSPAAVLVRTRQRAQAARKQLRAAARRRAAPQRPSDG